MDKSLPDSHIERFTHPAPLASKRIHDSCKYTSGTESVAVDGKLGEISKHDYEVLSEHLIDELSQIAKG